MENIEGPHSDTPQINIRTYLVILIKKQLVQQFSLGFAHLTSANLTPHIWSYFILKGVPTANPERLRHAWLLEGVCLASIQT